MGEPAARLVEALTRVVERVQAQSPLTVSVEVVDDLERDRPRVQLSAEVVDAFAGSLGEALRNVERHAGVDRARVRVEALPSGFAVSVADAGIGLRSDRPAGIGMTSIRDRMARVGGAAEFISAPGEGTVVRLAYTSRAGPRVDSLLADTYQRTVVATGDNRRIVRSVAIPLTLCHSYLAIRHSLTSPDHRVGLLLLALLFLLTTVAVVRHLERLAPTGPWLLKVSAWLAALSAAGMTLVPPGALESTESWQFGFASITVTLVVFFVPTRWALLVSFSQTVVALVAYHLRPALDDSFPLGAMNAPLTPGLVATMLGILIRRSSEAAQRASRRLVRATSALAAQESATAADAAYLEQARATLLPFLRGVLDKTIPLEQESTRRRAEVLGQTVRDDLVAPDFFDATVRESVVEFRRRGGRFVIREGAPSALPALMTGQVLMSLVRELPPGHRVIVAAAQDRPGGLRVAITPCLPSEIRRRLTADETLREHVAVEGDEYVTVLIVPGIPCSGERADSPRTGGFTHER